MFEPIPDAYTEFTRENHSVINNILIILLLFTYFIVYECLKNNIPIRVYK